MEISSVLCFLLSMHLIFSRTGVNGQKHLEVTQPELVRAEAGESVTITCSFISESESISYSASWTLGCNTNVALKDHPCLQHRVKLISLDDLQTSHSPQAPSYKKKTGVTIINVTENDSGRFCCHIKTTEGETGTGMGTRLEVTPRTCPEAPACPDSPAQVRAPLVVEIIRIICLIVLIILLVIAVKKS